MVRMAQALAAWGQPEFSDVLKQSIKVLGADELPLQDGLATGSYALDDSLDAMVVALAEKAESIEAKVGLFYRSLTPGCACAGDPTVETEQTEYCVVMISIDKHTAEASFSLLEE